MTLVSEQEFITNGAKYLDIALTDKVYIKRGDINFIVTTEDSYTDEVDEDFDEDEEKFDLYESLNRAFADMRLMMDGKKKGKTIDELIAELESEYELQDRSNN
jgi:hypothetical protein